MVRNVSVMTPNELDDVCNEPSQVPPAPPTPMGRPRLKTHHELERVAQEDEDKSPQIQRGDSVADRAFQELPIIANLVNFALSSVELIVLSVKWFKFSIVTVTVSFRLVAWAMIIMPVFLFFFARYLTDPRIVRRVRYGISKREFLDIYAPKQAWEATKGNGAKVPVVIGIMGVGFVIGHRGYNVQLGLRCMELGIMFVCLDYRNFPFATIPEMVGNVGRGVRWVFRNIADYGGDVDNMMFMGQSAGAHLGAMLILEHAFLETEYARDQKGEFDSWQVKKLKAYVGVSGPYDLQRYAPHLGLPQNVLESLSMGSPDDCCPAPLLLTQKWQALATEAACRLPEIFLLHGETDMLVPAWSSVRFAEQLKEAGIPAKLDVRAGVNHTYPVVEGPAVRHDIQMEYILPILLGEKGEAMLDALPRQPRPMWPHWLLSLANVIGPFGTLDLENALKIKTLPKTS